MLKIIPMIIAAALLSACVTTDTDRAQAAETRIKQARNVNLSALRCDDMGATILQSADSIEVRYSQQDEAEAASKGLTVATFIPIVGIGAILANIGLNWIDLSTRELTLLNWRIVGHWMQRCGVVGPIRLVKAEKPYPL